MSAWDKLEELQRPVPDEIGFSLQEDHDEADTAEDMQAQAAHVAEFVAQMELASPEILRVTPAFRAFQHGFQALRGAKGIDLYSKSRRSHKIAAFWSHSWHGARWKKILTLVTIYNGQAAITLGMFVAVVMMVLFCFLDLPGFDRHDGHYRKEHWSVWSTWSGFLATSLVAIFWRPQTHVFLDRICISQSNAELKLKGIVSLAGLLRRSESMLVLWDPTWTTRLWCLFELAAFLKSSEHEGEKRKLIIAPTLLGPVRSGIFLTATAGVLAFIMSPAVPASASTPQYYFLNTTFVTLVVLLVVDYALVSTLRSYFRDLDTMRRQLLSVSFDTALCACCTHNHVTPTGAPGMCDRKILKDCLGIWFGSSESFERTLRSEVLEILEQDLERVLTTRSTIAIFAPMMWGFMDYSATFSRVAGPFWSHSSPAVFAAGLVVWLVGMPTLKDWVLLNCKLARARPSNRWLEGMKNTLIVCISLIPLISIGLIFLFAYGLPLLPPGHSGVAMAGTLIHAVLFQRLGVVLRSLLGAKP